MYAEDFSLSPFSREEGDLKKLEIIFLSVVSEYKTTAQDKAEEKIQALLQARLISWRLQRKVINGKVAKFFQLSFTKTYYLKRQHTK